ncbi:acyltransferase family protein [Vibrio sp. SCSIO 43136]|uniref:acyltransferase n=1 Tax=Vibrio sp. SCSIO 43136 TaxID=2819101 RepID=UPI002076030C|nr:acyltransferase family protein [Vibrio sp. SCSIO 43136]USD67007.1 acyltransferase family protein [Vibrio sp. SCSIO 43136]
MSQDKIHSFEFGRVIAILAIVAMHCQMFLSYWHINEEPWVAYIFNQLTRFAVPLFFLISGYLIAPRLTDAPIATLKRYSVPLLRIFVVWSVICLLMPFNLEEVAKWGYLAERQSYWDYLLSSPINSLFEGGLVHLWFIPALLCSVLITALLAKFRKLELLIPLGIALYVYGVLAGSYHTFTGLESFIFTRNGPFFSTLLFAIGFTIRQESIQATRKQATILTIVGCAMHLSEAFIVHQYGYTFNMNDFLFGTVLWGAGCFMWLLAQPELGQTQWLTKQSRYVLPMYVTHLPVAILMTNLAGYLGLTYGMRDVVMLSGTLVFSYLLIRGIEKTPFYRWLYR